MAKLLSGREAASALDDRTRDRAEALRARGIEPKLAILRVGENPSDLSYEAGALKRAAAVGVAAEVCALDETADREAVLGAMRSLDADPSVHGVLMFRPLPASLRSVEREVCALLRPDKDVDCMTELSLAGVFADRRDLGFAPCTPQACLELLDHYGIETAGRGVVIIGRSLVVGKPLAAMLMARGRDATVTVCHTRTRNLAEIARGADILISAAGALGSLTKDCVRPGQVVVDVAINWDANKPNRSGGMGAIAGDAAFEEVEPVVDAITPVPGGVGAVTTSVLLSHVVEAAERQAKGAIQSHG